MKLCPMRKTKVVVRYQRAWSDTQGAYIDTLTPAEWKEEFLPCLGEECAWFVVNSKPEASKCAVLDIVFAIDGMSH